MLGSKTRHLLRHCCFVRPGTSAATASQLLPPYACTESFNFLSSSSNHLPASAVVRSMLGSKRRHLLRHCCFVRPGTSAATANQLLPPYACTESFSLLSSASVHLPLLPPVRAMLGSQASRHLLLHCFSFDLEPEQQLHPNPCHRALVPNPATYCLRLLSIDPHVPSLGRC
jgi:hypothetical protein